MGLLGGMRGVIGRSAETRPPYELSGAGQKSLRTINEYTALPVFATQTLG